MLKKRVITTLWGVPLLVAAVWFDEPLPWLTILVAILGVLAIFEFYRMVTAAKVPPLTYFGLIWTLLFIVSPHFDYAILTPLLLASAVVLPLIWLVLRRQKEEAFVSWAWTIAGILYVGWLLSYLVALRGLETPSMPDAGRDCRLPELPIPPGIQRRFAVVRGGVRRPGEPDQLLPAPPLP